MFHRKSAKLIGSLIIFYLNSGVEKLIGLIFAPAKLDVLKTNIYPRSKALKNMLVLRTSNFQGATMRLVGLRHKHSIVFIVHDEIFSAPVQKLTY